MSEEKGPDLTRRQLGKVAIGAGAALAGVTGPEMLANASGFDWGSAEAAERKDFLLLAQHLARENPSLNRAIFAARDAGEEKIITIRGPWYVDRSGRQVTQNTPGCITITQAKWAFTQLAPGLGLATISWIGENNRPVGSATVQSVRGGSGAPKTEKGYKKREEDED